MNWSIAFEPLLSWPLAGRVLVPVALLALAGLWFRQRGALFRFAALAALAAALINPVLLDEEREPLKSVVALIVDRSQSQDIGDAAPTRPDAGARRACRSGSPASSSSTCASSRPARPNAADDRTETRLFGALESAFRDVPPSRIGGAVMITDGQVHDVPARAPEYHGAAACADHRRRGREGPPHPLRERAALRHRRQAARHDLSRHRHRRRDAARSMSAFRSTASRSLSNAPRSASEMPLELAIPGAGRNIVELAIDPVEGELTDTNNRAIAMIDGIRENLRVLLVSGEPHAGERTWRNLLKSDASVDLVHFTILRPPEKQDGTPINELSLIAFPTRELFVEKINDFDLIIFDRYQHRDVLPILYYDYIAEYVEKGGALLIAAGPEYAGEQSIAHTPLMSALPAMPTGEIVDEAFYPRLTEIGKRHPVTRGLEGSAFEPPHWSRWFRLIGIEHPEGEVGDEGARRPAAAAARPQGRRPRRHAAVRPGLAVGARLRGRRPACRALPPHRPLADEGARTRGGAPDRRRPRHGARHPPPDDERRSRSGAGDHAVRQDARPCR